jgi:hypothetical protein
VCLITLFVRELLRPAETVDKLHLSDGGTWDLKQSGVGADNRKTPGATDCHVQPVPAVEEFDVSRKVLTGRVTIETRTTGASWPWNGAAGAGLPVGGSDVPPGDGASVLAAGPAARAHALANRGGWARRSMSRGHLSPADRATIAPASLNLAHALLSLHCGDSASPWQAVWMRAVTDLVVRLA